MVGLVRRLLIAAGIVALLAVHSGLPAGAQVPVPPFDQEGSGSSSCFRCTRFRNANGEVIGVGCTATATGYKTCRTRNLSCSHSGSCP